MAKAASPENVNPDEAAPEGVEQDIRGGEIAVDMDGDGKPELDPDAVETTLADLVTLDHALRDHGLTVVDLLKHVAASSRGIFV